MILTRKKCFACCYASLPVEIGYGLGISISLLWVLIFYPSFVCECLHCPKAKYYPCQIRSHAQKYFLKVQKKGTSEHVPPPRPKRKATHPYPQKAPKTGQQLSIVPLLSLQFFFLLKDLLFINKFCSSSSISSCRAIWIFICCAWTWIYLPARFLICPWYSSYWCNFIFLE